MVAGRQAVAEVATAAPGTMRKANAESVSVIRKEADMNRYSGLVQQNLYTDPWPPNRASMPG